MKPGAMKLGTLMKRDCIKAVSDPNPQERRPKLLAVLERYAKQVNDEVDDRLEAEAQARGFEESLAQTRDVSEQYDELIEFIGDVERGVRTPAELYAKVSRRWRA